MLRTLPLPSLDMQRNVQYPDALRYVLDYEPLCPRLPVSQVSLKPGAKLRIVKLLIVNDMHLTSQSLAILLLKRF